MLQASPAAALLLLHPPTVSATAQLENQPAQHEMVQVSCDEWVAGVELEVGQELRFGKWRMRLDLQHGQSHCSGVAVKLTYLAIFWN